MFMTFAIAAKSRYLVVLRCNNQLRLFIMSLRIFMIENILDSVPRSRHTTETVEFIFVIETFKQFNVGDVFLGQKMMLMLDLPLKGKFHVLRLSKRTPSLYLLTLHYSAGIALCQKLKMETSQIQSSPAPVSWITSRPWTGKLCLMSWTCSMAVSSPAGRWRGYVIAEAEEKW